MGKLTFESRYLNPLTDFGFHKLFGNEECKKLLINFLNELFRLAEVKRLTKEEMEEYKKSVLEYQDVRDAVDYAREEGFEEGIEKGREEGREEEKVTIIQKCIQMNLPIENIVFLTGFSREQIIKYTGNQK